MTGDEGKFFTEEPELMIEGGSDGAEGKGITGVPLTAKEQMEAIIVSGC